MTDKDQIQQTHRLEGHDGTSLLPAHATSRFPRRVDVPGPRALNGGLGSG